MKSSLNQECKKNPTFIGADWMSSEIEKKQLNWNKRVKVWKDMLLGALNIDVIDNRSIDGNWLKNKWNLSLIKTGDLK